MLTVPVVVLVALALGAAGRAIRMALGATAVGRRLDATAATDVASPPPAAPFPVLVIAVGLAGLLGGPVVAGLGVAAALVAPLVVARRRAAAGARAEIDALPDVVDAMARAFRGGVAPAAALRSGAAVAPAGLAAAIDAAAGAAERGVPLAAALDRWAAHAAAPGGDGRELVAATFAVHAVAGGDPARSLSGVADTLRERRALRREVRALSSQARLSAAVVAAAPAALGGLAVATDDATADFLLRTPAGAACLVAGLVLEIVGWLWMDRITRSIG